MPAFQECEVVIDLGQQPKGCTISAIYIAGWIYKLENSRAIEI